MHGDQPCSLDLGAESLGDGRDAAGDARIDQEVAGIGIERHGRGSSVQQVALEIFRDDEDAVELAAEDRALGAWFVGQFGADGHIGRGIDAAGELAAAVGAVEIDEGDRHVAQGLAPVGLGIEGRIDAGCQNEHGECRPQRQDAL